MFLESLFFKGYEYQEFLHMLRKHHNVTISLSTIKGELKQYKLHRNKMDFDPQVLRNAIVDIIDGLGSSVGYRSVWHSLQKKGIRVPRSKVEEIVRELDPDGDELRKTQASKVGIYLPRPK